MESLPSDVWRECVCKALSPIERAALRGVNRRAKTGQPPRPRRFHVRGEDALGPHLKDDRRSCEAAVEFGNVVGATWRCCSGRGRTAALAIART